MSSPLLPPERMALTVARAQIKRGEDPTPNVAAVLIMALARLVDKIGDEETQLQAIADAWNAAGQTFPTRPENPPARGREKLRIFWPELTAAIEGALTKEDNDEN